MSPSIDALVAELADVGRDAVARHLVLASGGNLSARLPGDDTFVVTAAGTWLDRLTGDDFSVLGLDGTVRAGDPVPSTEWKLHARTYAVRPDVRAVIHLHPQAPVIVDACGHAVRLLTLDHAFYVGRINRIPFFHNGSDELADASAEASRDSNAIILAHHGSSTLGETIAMAYRRSLSLDQAAEATLRCLAIGDTDARFPPDAMAELHHG